MRRWTTGLILGAGAAGLVWAGAERWRADTVARLKAGSTCVQTARGAVECSILYPQADKTPVLVLHGSPGGYDQGELVGGYIFSAERKLIVPSRPGYLRTSLELGKTPAEQAELYAALLDALNIDKVIVFAYSGGGASAMEFAARYPDRAAALILVAAVTRAIDTNVKVNLYDKLNTTAWLALKLSMMVPFTLSQAAVSSTAIRDALRHYAETGFPLDLRVEGWYNDVEQFRTMPPFPPHDQIQCPTLIAHGTADETVPYEHAKSAAATIPDAKLVSIEGGEHNVSIFEPVVGRQIYNLLRDHGL